MPFDFSKYTPEPEPSVTQKYLPPIIRGGAGLLATEGGPTGAGINALGEYLAQSVENRKDYNPASIAAAAGLGLIPFGGEATAVKAGLKGAAASGLGTALMQQSERGLHAITPKEAKDIAISTAIGGVVGGGAHAIFDRYSPRVGESVKVETPGASKEVREVQKATEQANANATEVPQTTKTKISGKPDEVKGSTISEVASAPEETKYTDSKGRAQRIRKNSPEEGKQILAQIAAEQPKVTIDTTTGEEIPIPEVKLGEGNRWTRFTSAVKESKPADWINLPKAGAASGDVSAPFSNGLIFAGRKAWRDAWMPMLKSV
jgi:hypothetical protein